MLNFFQSTVNIDILILENGIIQVKNDGRTIFEGSKEECMNKIRHEVLNLQGIGNKTVSITIKSWSIYSASEQLIADAKSYFRNHISLLKSASKNNIEFSFRPGGGFGGGGGRSW